MISYWDLLIVRLKTLLLIFICVLSVWWNFNVQDLLLRRLLMLRISLLSLVFIYVIISRGNYFCLFDWLVVFRWLNYWFLFLLLPYLSDTFVYVLILKLRITLNGESHLHVISFYKWIHWLKILCRIWNEHFQAP